MKKHTIYAFSYLANILIFAVVYTYVFPTDFQEREVVDLLTGAYVSVVTVTTLGFGDFIPNATSSGLMASITLQVVFGVINIGLFLNALSDKNSEQRENEAEQKKIEEDKKKQNVVSKVIQPILEEHIRTLANIYKVTYSGQDFSNRKVSLADMFTEEYFDQVVMVDYYSNNSFYHGSNLLGNDIHNDFMRFKNSIDNVLGVYLLYIDADIADMLLKLKSSRFLTYPQQSLQSYQFAQGRLPNQHMISLEHSTQQSLFPDQPKSESVRVHHTTLIELVKLLHLDIHFEAYMQNGTAPRVGESIAQMFRFGPYPEEFQ